MRRRHSLLLALLVLSAASQAWAGERPPRGFFGAVPQGEIAPAELHRMAGTVETLRVAVYWPEVEPSPGTFDFRNLDEVVGGAAAAGIAVLPDVYGSPPWVALEAARPPLSTPEDRGAWRSLLRRLVRRYGPEGRFWRGRRRRVPIRSWQIWNEPNFAIFWRPRPQPVRYARLLRLSAAAVRGVDPGARIVAAGVAPIEHAIAPWRFLERMYARAPWVSRAFDEAAVHPYSPTVAGMEVLVRRVRRAMARAGDGAKPLLVSELGVASDASAPTAYDEGLGGQASFLRAAYGRLLAKRRRWRIGGVDWFATRDAPSADPHCSFCQYAGLFDRAGRPKPSWYALRKVVAGAVR
jgi:hypothetical protein